MLLAIDVGNSNTVLGLYNHDSPDLVADWRITTHKNQTSDEYGVLFMNLFAMRQIDVSKISAIWSPAPEGMGKRTRDCGANRAQSIAP